MNTATTPQTRVSNTGNTILYVTVANVFVVAVKIFMFCVKIRMSLATSDKLVLLIAFFISPSVIGMSVSFTAV